MHFLPQTPDTRDTMKLAADGRPSARKRGYSRKVGKGSASLPEAAPDLCAVRDRSQVQRSGREVDHIAPHRGDLRQFWDKRNWQGIV